MLDFLWEFYYWLIGRKEEDFITEQVVETKPLVVDEFIRTPLKPPKFVALSPAFGSPFIKCSPRVRQRKKRKLYFPDIIEEDYVS